MNHFKDKKIYYLTLILMIFILVSYSINNSSADNKELKLSKSIPRVVLIELFVQATCTTCPHAEFCLEELAWEYGPEKIILLEEHLWGDGYDIPETNSRYDWYVEDGVKGTPDVFINGLNNRIQGLACECGDIDENYLYYKKVIDSELTRPSYLELSASKIVHDSSIVIEGKVKNVSNITLENMVVCGMVYKDCNELGLCYWVQDILPSKDIPQLLPGDTYTYNITSEPFLQEENNEVPIHVVVFVQDIKSPTKEVLQALYVPFSIALAGASPSIHFQEESWDFGDITPDELPTHIFEFKNYGDEELIIKDIKVDCESCADALPSTKNIKPGETGKIKVTINSLDMKGRFSKRVYIFTNDPAHPRVTLNLSGFIKEKEVSFPVYMVYFYEQGCHDCDKAKAIWTSIRQEYPNLIIKSYDISLAENVELAEALGELYKMPEEERLLVPVIFIGNVYLFRNAITYANLEELIQQNSNKENIPPWEMVKEEEIEIKERLITRFQSFGFAAVAVSGLIDGINPCAFATIIFFISYLTLINRKGKEILWVGGMFAFAVFLTYFLIGTEALKIATTLSFLPLARKIFSIVTAGIALILGLISLLDYIQFKKKRTTKDVKLQLSPFLKNMIHSTIRKNVRLSNYILMAAVTGFIVSLLELACTGQIYLPTLMFISTIPNLKINAIFYLLLYNLMFIVPLVLVFAFTYWGTSSAQWAALTQRNFGKIKMAMTLLFFGLAALLLYTGIFY